MVDFLSPRERSKRMSLIRGRDTQPELVLRRALHRLGLRFRLHGAGLPGKPDLVFPRYKVVVFVHGCFWHQHAGCKIATIPKSNTQFWVEKFKKNIGRDKKVIAQLNELGWKVIVVWECELSTMQKIEMTSENIAFEIKSQIL
ncbi:very short patch repair endonuclease [Burkholderia pseudomultivorans]|uniref:very short patch repair endonuclease n=1 Tax=Burkholderia pseudomultivorans TaxID=1207504 RepID=UPI0009C16114|nr:DNA mismatch endonuclease Vsr [Burkholderia pseudomultivorans]